DGTRTATDARWQRMRRRRRTRDTAPAISDGHARRDAASTRVGGSDARAHDTARDSSARERGEGAIGDVPTARRDARRVRRDRISGAESDATSAWGISLA